MTISRLLLVKTVLPSALVLGTVSIVTASGCAGTTRKHVFIDDYRELRPYRVEPVIRTQGDPLTAEPSEDPKEGDTNAG